MMRANLGNHAGLMSISSTFLLPYKSSVRTCTACAVSCVPNYISLISRLSEAESTPCCSRIVASQDLSNVLLARPIMSDSAGGVR